MEADSGEFKTTCRFFPSNLCSRNSQNQRHSRAYIDFKSPGDVLEFAQFFNGHRFVNEKGKISRLFTLFCSCIWIDAIQGPKLDIDGLD